MKARRSIGAGSRTTAAIWQEIEFGAYAADLPLWDELAAASPGAVLELGGGSGRVSLHLAERGFAVTAIEVDPELAAELERRAGERHLPVTVVCRDMREIAELGFGESPGLTIAPLHVIQSLDPPGRRELLAALPRALPRGAAVGVTLVDESSLSAVAGRAAPTPDLREVEGWVYASEPLWVQVGEGTLTVRRIRQRVSPDGELERFVRDEVLHRISPEGFEREARAAGLAPAGRRSIRSGRDEANSVAVLLEVP